MRIVLAGEYPEGTYEEVSRIFSTENEVIKINKIDDYEKMTNAEIIILRIFKANKDVIERNKNLKMIVRWGAGYDSVDIKSAGEKGVVVTNTPGANSKAVAELTVLFMLALNRKLLNHVSSLRKGVWSKNNFLNESFMLNNKTIGIIGSGNIGQNVAKIVRVFGAKVIYYDVSRLNEEKERSLLMNYVDFETLIKTSDIITLHIPLLESTKNIIGSKEIDQMKNGAMLINASRGGLVDEKALLDGIKSKKLSGAALDCVQNEPLDKNDELLNTPNIIITPHIGGGTSDLKEIIIDIMKDDISDFISGKEVNHIVNKEWLK
ncbi:NAD(P)-dependent oxidoreductase [Fusobacterium sp. PH5-44]|uniref:NAD(P)-dependent oxidoreductase n=1 Tax=unclassified Fusobacterium TaxID=2648384 RepID=UPI003D1D2B81